MSRGWGPKQRQAYNDGMRIFLAGASGVIGQRLIPRLVQAGHVVGGLTRSPSKTELLSHLGAEPILCDVFDREALIQVSTALTSRAAEIPRNRRASAVLLTVVTGTGSNPIRTR